MQRPRYRLRSSSTSDISFPELDSDFNRGVQNLQKNPRDLLKLSCVDTRRIAALKSRQRIRERIGMQDVLMKKGMWELTDTSRLFTLTQQHMAALHSLWEQMVKFVHFSGIHYLDHLWKHSERVREVLDQRQKQLGRTRPDFGPREDLERKRRAGRLVVFHITDLLVNIRQRHSLRELVGKKLDLLLGMGFTPDDVQHLSMRTVSYLQNAHPSHWNRQVDHACSVILKYLRTLGNEHLTERFPKYGLFRDPVNNIVYNPRLEL